MQKALNATVVQLVAAGLILLCQAAAQDAPAARPATSTKTGSAQAAGSSKSTATKKPASTTRSSGAVTLKTQKEKASYAVGMSIGMGLKRQPLGVDPALVSRGVKDAMTGGKMLMTEDEMKAALQQLRTDVNKQQEEQAHTAGATNRKQGEVFLAANKSKPGVTTLPDGLQYKILTAGTGPKPTANDTVTVNYRGTLINGKEFDSSYKAGKPISFPVGGVIRGWTEALQLMPVGSKWELYIPADLAYGDRGAGPDIGPGDTLIFEVELLAIGEQKK